MKNFYKKMYSLKFGGTSMGSAKNIAQVAKILTQVDIHKQKSAVVSAMSGVTDLLLNAGSAAIEGQKNQVKKYLEGIEKKYFQAIDGLITGNERKNSAKKFILEKISELADFLQAIEIIGEISPKSHDKIVSLGEVLSAFLLAEHLSGKGVQTEFVNLEKIIKNPPRKADEKFFEMLKISLQEKILPLLEQKKIPIITGFFGEIPGGIVAAVGRGYSDFTAALVGDACQAEEIQIWTDVSGILSADPRIVNDAIALDEISFKEASELANFGAKVIHPQTIWPAVKNNIPVRIKNTMNPTHSGTRITREGKISKYPFKSITAKKDITILNMHSFEMIGHGFMAKVFNILAEYEVSVDMISTSEASISVTIDKGFEHICDAVEKLEKFCRVQVCQNRAILSVIGIEMQGIIGLSGGIFSALGDAGINIKMISQGATELNISAVIDEKDITKGIEAIHKKYF